MKSSQEVSHFELVLEGPASNKPDLQNEIIKLLRNRCGFRMVEIDGLLSHGPLTVRRSVHRSELELLGKELTSAGGKVSIVAHRIGSKQR